MPISASILRKMVGNNIAIDLDGTLAQMSPPSMWGDLKHFGPVIPGAAQAMKDLKKLGYRIIIYTARINGENCPVKKVKGYVEKWLKDNDIVYDQVWDQMGKPASSFIIDDRAIEFTDWPSALEKVINKKIFKKVQ